MIVVATIARQARFLDWQFWKDYAITMRPYLLFISAMTGIAGLSLVPAVPVQSLLILGVVFFFAYGFGQALTDCFQTDTDAISAPYRPLVRGALEARDVLVISLIGLVVSAVIVVAFNPINIIAAGLTVVGLATYTHFKRRWWAGPWYNAWIVSLLVLIGYHAAAGSAGRDAGLTLAVFGTMFAAFAAYANFVLTGYFKDITADRATGYRTLPVVFGRKASAWVSDGIALLGFVGAGIAVLATDRNWRVGIAIPFLLAALAFAGVAQWRLHRVRADGEAHRAVEPTVHSFLLLMAGLSAVHQPTWAPFLVALYVAFTWTMKRRPMSAQI